MKREKLIGFKVTDFEDATIRHKAEKINMSISKYVRSAALDKQVIVIEGLEKWLPELGRIGNNLNQLTVILRTREARNIEFMQIKIDFQRLVEAVTIVLQGRNNHGDN